MSDVAQRNKNVKHPERFVPGVFSWRGLIAFCAVFWIQSAAAATLEDVKSAGVLQCGVDAEGGPFSKRGADGQWVGFHVEFCRALAAAILGDGAKINFTGLKVEERVEALQSGEIDVLVSQQPVQSTLELEQGVVFVEPLYIEEKTEKSYAPAVRQGDDEWFSIVRVVRHSLVRAEFGEVPGLVKGLGPDWFKTVAASVGHYGAMFTRSFGADAKRGALWAPPFE
jgi:Bacterial extracellular solute-binding proteins, family 3